MKRLALMLMLQGCASIGAPEVAYQSIHAIDSLQTIQIARSPSCFYETGTVTQDVIGRHPSVGGVIAWEVAVSAAHYYVTHLLERNEAPRWVVYGWQSLSIGHAARQVRTNDDQGIGAFSGGC